MPSSPQIAPAELAGAVKRRGAALALDRLDLTLVPGQVTALLGPNGAGKSTAVGLLTGALNLDAGAARLFGADPRTPRARRRLGVMLQAAGMPRGLTVAEQIDLFAGCYPAPRSVADCVELAGLAGLEKRRCAALSGGQQRRLQFALALCGRPDLLILDEPTTAMDAESRRALWAVVRAEAARGAAVLITTHHLEEAEALADRVVVIDRGRMIADATPAQLKARAAAGAIRCRTRLTDDDLSALPGVTGVVRQGAGVVLTSVRPQQSVSALLAADPLLEDLTLTGASLEDAFTRLIAAAAGGGDLEIAA